MKRQLNRLCTLILFLLLTACSKPYYGYTEKDWNNLPEKEKIAIKNEYKRIIDSRNEQKHTDKINARTQSVIESGVSHPDR